MDWTAVSPEAQKQKSLICFIRFYVTVDPKKFDFGTYTFRKAPYQLI